MPSTGVGEGYWKEGKGVKGAGVREAGGVVAGTCTSGVRSSSSMAARLGVVDATELAGFLLRTLNGFWEGVETMGAWRACREIMSSLEFLRFRKIGRTSPIMFLLTVLVSPSDWAYRDVRWSPSSKMYETSLQACRKDCTLGGRS